MVRCAKCGGPVYAEHVRVYRTPRGRSGGGIGHPRAGTGQPVPRAATGEVSERQAAGEINNAVNFGTGTRCKTKIVYNNAVLLGEGAWTERRPRLLQLL